MGKIAELLLDRFESVYCNTCEYQESEENCEECHRKSMNWSLSEEKALELEKAIMEIMEEE